MVVALAAFAVPLRAAHAYSSPTSGMPLPVPPTGTSSFDFNFGNSFQTLVAPFQAFFNSLANSIGNQPIVGPSSGSNVPAPTINLPDMNLNGGSHQLDQWFSNLFNLNFAQFATLILNWILWVLGLAQQLIQWLLGQIH